MLPSLLWVAGQLASMAVTKAARSIALLPTSPSISVAVKSGLDLLKALNKQDAMTFRYCLLRSPIGVAGGLCISLVYICNLIWEAGCVYPPQAP